MLIVYKKFCCGVFYMLKDKAKSDVHYFGTFMLTLYLLELFLFGANSAYHILSDVPVTSLRENSLIYYFSLLAGVPNYLFVFRNKSFMEYYPEKMNSFLVAFIILLVNVFCLFFVIKLGPIKHV